MKIYKIINGKCTTISVVEDPAIEEDFIKLKSDKLYKFDQQILIGPALVPDKPIYRNDEHGEYYISFDASSIKQIAADYLKHLQINIDHKESIPATVLERNVGFPLLGRYMRNRIMNRTTRTTSYYYSY